MYNFKGEKKKKNQGHFEIDRCDASRKSRDRGQRKAGKGSVKTEKKRPEVNWEQVKRGS